MIMMISMKKMKKHKNKNLLGHLNLERESVKVIAMINMMTMMVMIGFLRTKEEENQKLLMRL